MPGTWREGSNFKLLFLHYIFSPISTLKTWSHTQSSSRESSFAEFFQAIIFFQRGQKRNIFKIHPQSFSHPGWKKKLLTSTKVCLYYTQPTFTACKRGKSCILWDGQAVKKCLAVGTILIRVFVEYRVHIKNAHWKNISSAVVVVSQKKGAKGCSSSSIALESRGHEKCVSYFWPQLFICFSLQTCTGEDDTLIHFSKAPHMETKMLNCVMWSITIFAKEEDLFISSQQ